MLIKALTLLNLVLFALPAWADRSLCDDAARFAAHKSGVPPQILRAITLTETMYRGSAWPWTINHRGEGHWFKTREAAVTAAAELMSQGASADLGCFQINSQWHGEAFPSAEAMLDPIENALYAARYLSDLHARLRDWDLAVAAYHSRDPARGATYLARVKQAQASLSAGSGHDANLVPPRRNRFPLLLAGDPGSAGSVMPKQPGLAPLIGGP